MRQIDGWMISDSIGHEDPAPYVQAQVSYLDAREQFLLLIDTGSDVTVLMPKEAYRLFGDAFFEFDFHDVAASFLIEGVGGAYRSIQFEMLIRIEDENADHINLGRRVWVAEPTPDYPSEAGNWTLPSIFGRDAIRPGDFELSYINNTVTLIRPDDE